MIYQDRVTSILDAHLSNQSNRLNEVMKVLTYITTIAVPFTVLGGLFGMNVKLPGVNGDGNPELFWWILGGSALFVVVIFVVLARCDASDAQNRSPVARARESDRGR